MMMGKEMRRGIVIEAEMVSILLDAARDLITALSAENARLRDELKSAKSSAEYHEGRSSYWNKQCWEYMEKEGRDRKLAKQKRIAEKKNKVKKEGGEGNG